MTILIEISNQHSLWTSQTQLIGAVSEIGASPQFEEFGVQWSSVGKEAMGQGSQRGAVLRFCFLSGCLVLISLAALSSLSERLFVSCQILVLDSPVNLALGTPMFLQLA